MREIKFRGKRVDNGEWATSQCHLGTMASGTVIHDFDPATVGQYTGLKDKNGVEIYESDIVENRFYALKGKVFYWQYEGRYAVDDMYDGKQLITGDMWEGVEVIGNIFDNPELMEVVEK